MKKQKIILTLGFLIILFFLLKPFFQKKISTRKRNKQQQEFTDLYNTNKELSQQLITQADKYWEANLLDSALILYEQSLKTLPAPGIRKRIAIINYQKCMEDSTICTIALSAVNDAIGEMPSDSKLFLWRSRIYKQLHNIEKAERDSIHFLLFME